MTQLEKIGKHVPSAVEDWTMSLRMDTNNNLILLNKTRDATPNIEKIYKKS